MTISQQSILAKAFRAQLEEIRFKLSQVGGADPDSPLVVRFLNAVEDLNTMRDRWIAEGKKHGHR